MSVETIVKPFDRLRRREFLELCDFLVHPDLQVKGLDRSDTRAYRAGCLPYLVLGLGFGIAFLTEDLGLPGPVGIGVGLAAAAWGAAALVHAVVAALRSRRVLVQQEGWHALAWTQNQLCFRSLDLCLLAPWSAIERFELFGADAGKTLGGTLWIHLKTRDRILVEPRGPNDTFAGRSLQAWGAELQTALQTYGEN